MNRKLIYILSTTAAICLAAQVTPALAADASSWEPCPAQERPNARDPRVRMGTTYWMRLDKVVVAKSASGTPTLDVQLTAWNVSGQEGIFAPNVVVGSHGEPQVSISRSTGIGGDLWRGDPNGPAHCGSMTVTYRTTYVGRDFDSLMYEDPGEGFSLPWDIGAEVERAYEAQSQPPAPQPQPQPPAPQPQPPAPQPPAPPAGGTGGDHAPGGARAMNNFGVWDFKVDELIQGPDGDWQVVVTARNAAAWRQGMVASEVKAWLINDDGETIQNWGDLYKASSTGVGAGLARLEGTQWMEPGDQIRFRLLFKASGALDPSKFRLGSTGAQAVVKTWPMN